MQKNFYLPLLEASQGSLDLYYLREYQIYQWRCLLFDSCIKHTQNYLHITIPLEDWQKISYDATTLSTSTRNNDFARKKKKQPEIIYLTNNYLNHFRQLFHFHTPLILLVF